MRMLLPHPEKNSVFKRFSFNIKLSFFLLYSLTFLNLGFSQSVSIGNFFMPDTVNQNSISDVNFNIRNSSDSISILGNMKLNFLNETTGTIAPLGGFSAIQFFAPQQERSFNIVIDITPQYFLEGGNTVVIWPSFVGQPIQAEDSIRFNVYVNTINGVENGKNQLASAYLIPNPMKDELSIQTIGQAKMPESIVVRELSGRTILNQQLNNSGKVDFKLVPAGIYILEMKLSDGNIITQRIVRIAD